MRILSLLPSATEIVFALGLQDDLVGVTHECDWPAAARHKRTVSMPVVPLRTDPAEIDRLVSESIGDGDPVYRLDTDAVRDVRPDIVLTQDLCAVCAVPSGHVTEALDVLGCSAQVISLDPSSLDQVLACVLDVGEATDTATRATAVVEQLQGRLETVRSAVDGRPRPRTFALEWSDPPFNAGHWVPDMVDAAGGEAVLGCPGTPSVRVSWEQIAAAVPEAVVFMPCGYGLDEAVAEAQGLLARPGLDAAEMFLAVDASGYFSRPGPRLVDGVEILASQLHPGSVSDRWEAAVRRLR